ncbi:MAG TPA: hypothetical protein VK165_06490 [Azonexus sp.]|nr:hypothetical protein [Azonexus sp.]
MASTTEYMQFALGVYNATTENKIAPPAGWSFDQALWQPDRASGFSAGCYVNGSEMVISYTGTNGGMDYANWFIGLGAPMNQIYEAVGYYFACKAAHPEATNITFTGHSLGGGLASLMSVYFNKLATVFDEAPFQIAALNPYVTDTVAAYMITKGYNDAAFSDYITFAGLPALTRESNITHYYIEGEALGFPRFSFDTLMGSDNQIPLNDSTAGSVDRHSMSLMLSFQLSSAFHQVAQALPDLVSMTLDGNLFAANPLDSKPDLLRTFLRHQLGVAGVVQPDDMLNRFAADMNTVVQAQSGRSVFYSSEMLLKTVIAFAMEKYYSEDTSGDPNAQQQLFEAVTGGLQFDTSRINGTITDAKGYQRYFTNYLNIDGVFTAGERNLIRSKIADMNDWSVAVSESGMTATDSKNKGAFMLGGAGGDTLTGGTANDLLVGGRGSDTLDGGDGTDTLIGGKDGDTFTGSQGADALYGGTGSDTYNYTTGDGSDTIYDYSGDGYDGDGKGRIQYDGTGLSGGIGGDAEGEVKKATAGGTFKSDDDKYTYSWGGDGSDLTVNGNITVKNFHNGDLGITLYTRKKKAPDPIPDTVANAYNGARSAIQRFGDPLTLDLNGNGIETVPLKRPPLFFDLNADGIKTSVGWIAPSDGLLALDRNGNGTIDDGSELFGDATPSYNTAGTTADGFAALAQEDTNHDGMVNAQDANFANLRVWQDLNQDGISQSDELSTLDAAGIASFNVARTAHSQMLPSGNQMADLGTFTRTDGSTGATGAPQAMADINLALDTFHRTFTDTIPLTAQAQVFPDMQGSGKVRDMREAASLQTAAGQAFSAALANFSAAATREEQLAQLDNLITAWANTSGFGTLQERAAANGYTFTTTLNADWQRKLTALEAFNGQGYFRMPWEGASFRDAANDAVFRTEVAA